MISVREVAPDKKHYPDLCIESDDKDLAQIPDQGEATIKYRSSAGRTGKIRETATAKSTRALCAWRFFRSSRRRLRGRRRILTAERAKLLTTISRKNDHAYRSHRYRGNHCRPPAVASGADTAFCPIRPDHPGGRAGSIRALDNPAAFTVTGYSINGFKPVLYLHSRAAHSRAPFFG